MSTSSNRILLGIDGGGSKTDALIASLDDVGQIHILGWGLGGPSNLRLAGEQQSFANLNKVVDEAIIAANLQGSTIDYAVLALAGSSFSGVREKVATWAEKRNLASHVEIIHDALPVLASGGDHSRGVALIIGTGSVAVGVNAKGESATLGGWGHWFGDKGSGFDLGCKALSAVAEASDGVGPPTVMSELVLERLGISDARQILEQVSSTGDVRREVAALAPIVLEAADLQDPLAIEIISTAIGEVIKLVDAMGRKLTFKAPYPLMVAGGVACRNPLFQNELISRLSHLDPKPDPIQIVDEPVNGCLKIAREHLTGSGTD